MEDQTKNQTLVREVAESEGLPPQLAKLIAQCEAIILLSVDADGVLRMQGTTKGGEFRPEHEATHAYVAAVYREHENLVRSMNGKPTDADRYRALREFSMLADSNPDRFEMVNTIVQKMEEAAGMTDDANLRGAEEHDKLADIIHQALIETEQSEAAPETEVEAAGIILPPGIKLN